MVKRVGVLQGSNSQDITPDQGMTNARLLRYASTDGYRGRRWAWVLLEVYFLSRPHESGRSCLF